MKDQDMTASPRGNPMRKDWRWDLYCKWKKVQLAEGTGRLPTRPNPTPNPNFLPDNSQEGT